MKVTPRNVMLVAFAIAGPVCASGESGEAAESASFATGASRLTVVPNSAADHVMAPGGDAPAMPQSSDLETAMSPRPDDYQRADRRAGRRPLRSTKRIRD